MQTGLIFMTIPRRHRTAYITLWYIQYFQGTEIYDGVRRTIAMTLRKGIHKDYSFGKLVMSTRKWEDDSNVNFRGKVVKKAGRYD